LVSSK